MTATIEPERWLEFIRTEYLESFIQDGGASIKFAVPLDDGMRAEIEDGIVVRARNAGYIVARLSSADTRVHMIDQLFFRIAAQVPWRQLSQDVIVKLAKEKGYASPAEGDLRPIGSRLAAANALGQDMLTMEARKWIEGHVFRQARLAKDFRVAVTQLCLAELSGGPDGETSIEVLVDWLTGRNKAISAVRPYHIFSRVTRSNARYLLESLLLWVRFAGYPGVIIILDVSRVTIPRNPHDDFFFYTKAAMLDTYEVLRQFIDGTDRMKGCLMIVMPALDFLDVEGGGRGMGVYDALKLRVYDEVHDLRLVNPMATLVRLSAGRDAG